jgi:translation initiation factor 3 subunit L
MYYDDDDYEYDSYAGGADYGRPYADARPDDAYDRQYASHYKIPEAVKSFITHFYDAYTRNDGFEIQNVYENLYPQLTEEYFKSTPWPEAADIAVLVDEDELFLTLYKELFYRHIYARASNALSVQHRFESYWNYCALFNLILSADRPVMLELPNQWLWDIVDEFIYQFQSYSQYRARLNKKTDEELDMLKKGHTVWNVHSVLNVLHSLVEKSNINKQLQAFTSGEEPDAVAGIFGTHSLYKMLGYFSLIGLLRLHSLLGDFYQALKVLDHIQLNKKNVFNRVPACQVTTYYYVGFAYMIMRRYADAIKTFSNILLYIQRTRNMFQVKNYQNDLINKQTEQMYILLSICMTLHPQLIDESLMQILRDKPHSERMAKMQRGDLQEFENSFSFACPKFLSPIPPSYDLPQSNFDKEPLQLQLKVFRDEVQQQLYIGTIRSYLKLYTTMPISKLASFLEMDEDSLKDYLLCFKHKMRNLVTTKNCVSALDGEFQSGSEVDFYIDGDMIHVADTKVSRRYGDFFIRQIHKFEELNHNLKTLPFA